MPYDKFRNFKFIQKCEASPSYIGMYILKDGIPVRENNTARWGLWLGRNQKNKHVVESYIYKPVNNWYSRLVGYQEKEKDTYWVSTVFLGLDHSFMSDEPILFETMITKNGEWLDYQTRCSTWEQALEMDVKACEWVWSEQEDF